MTHVRTATPDAAAALLRLAVSLAARAPGHAGRAVGYLLAFAQPALYTNGPVGWVQELVVEEAFRREELGRKPMDDFEAWARGRGAVLVALATRRAAAFCESLGYSESAAYFKKYP